MQVYRIGMERSLIIEEPHVVTDNLALTAWRLAFKEPVYLIMACPVVALYTSTLYCKVLISSGAPLRAVVSASVRQLRPSTYLGQGSSPPPFMNINKNRIFLHASTHT